MTGRTPFAVAPPAFTIAVLIAMATVIDRRHRARDPNRDTASRRYRARWYRRRLMQTDTVIVSGSLSVAPSGIVKRQLPQSWPVGLLPPERLRHITASMEPAPNLRPRVQRRLPTGVGTSGGRPSQHASR